MNYTIKLRNLCHTIIFNNNKRNTSRFDSPALFLDRDGVLIKDINYISDPDDVVLEKGAKEILFNAKKFNWKVIIITNQSGISRGYFDWDSYIRVTYKMIQLIGSPCPIDAIYANGFSTKSYWRKPDPGMLIQAKTDFNLNLRNSILIGDRTSDLEAGARLDLKHLYHVSTGHGHNEREIINHRFKKASRISNIKHNIYFSYNKKRVPLTFINNLLKFPIEIFTDI